MEGELEGCVGMCTGNHRIDGVRCMSRIEKNWDLTHRRKHARLMRACFKPESVDNVCMPKGVAQRSVNRCTIKVVQYSRVFNDEERAELHPSGSGILGGVSDFSSRMSARESKAIIWGKGEGLAMVNMASQSAEYREFYSAHTQGTMSNDTLWSDRRTRSSTAL